jgi:hypothetical protein
MDGNSLKAAEAATLLAFDEQWYLEKYPDVAAAVKEGSLRSGRTHFEHSGRAEGRLAFKFDPEWYQRSYSLANEEVGSGVVSSLLDHYLLLGRARGYLPHFKAARPRGASAAEGEFGGLWIDAPNASDLLAGRRETASITSSDAEHISFFMANGYVVLRGAVPPNVVEAARRALDDCYSGKYPALKFQCPTVSPEDRPWSAEMNEVPAKAIDSHMFSRALRDAMFAPAIMRFLGLIFDATPFASQTLGFLRGSAQEPHQDSAYVAYSIPKNFAATWIALEDVTPEAGELFYWPGSHHFPDFVYGGKYKSVSEARRMGTSPQQLSEEIKAHVRALPGHAASFGLKHERFLPRAGDVLVWHSELAHGGSPVSRLATRKSLVTHYCPKFLVPLFMEETATKTHLHSSGGRFVSGAYPALTPMD